MSSHREAREISKDPVADSTDVYAFVSHDKPDTVTLIANYIPLQEPAGGPNFYEFGEHVLYEIHVDNNGDAEPDITYQFRFTTKLTTPDSFLYNTGPIASLSDPHWNSKQFYSVTRVDRLGSHVLGENLPCPPCNVGPLSTPNYEVTLGQPAVQSLPGGIHVFAGQRAEEFYVDLGSIFDLANLRPLQGANVFAIADHLPSSAAVNATDHLNVHSIALQVPISQLTISGHPTIGVWTTASRQAARVLGADGLNTFSGPFTQVSRLANPLINEVIIPLGKKDYWNTQHPVNDKQFATYVAHPELAALLPVIYSPNFPNLQNIIGNTPRADLEAILLTGIPAGLIPSAPAFTNFTGAVQADLLRLNTSIAPTEGTGSYNVLGVVAGDLAGFPNGRRVADDVVTIELRAIAGLVWGLVDPGYTPDAVVGSVTDGLTGADVASQPLPSFPYLGTPYDGYHNPS